MPQITVRAPSAPPTDALAHFTARLAHRTDVSDVHAALESGGPVVVYCWCNGAPCAC